MNIDVAATLARRAAALLEMRARALVRAGLPIAGAYVNSVPMPRIVWAGKNLRSFPNA